MDTSFNTGFHGRDVKFSPFDPYRLAVATFDQLAHGHLLILDASEDSDSLVKTITFNTFRGLNECAWSRFFPNTIIAGDFRGSVLVFNLHHRHCTTLIARGHSSRISSIEWNPFYFHSFLTSGCDSDVKLWTAGEGNLPTTVYTHRDHKKIYSATWKPDHPKIFACAGDGTLRIYDTRLPDFVSEVGFGEYFGSFDWRKYDGNCIATADQYGRCIRVWDIRYTGNPSRDSCCIRPEPARVIPTGHALWKVKFSPQQTWQIASCSQDSEVALWNSQMGDPLIENYFHHEGPVFGLDMSIGFDMSILMASTGPDGLVHFWERPTEVVPNL